MSPFWCRIASLLMALAVGMGAFGAHALRGRIDADMLDVYKIAAFYHMTHALGLFAVAWIISETNDTRGELAGCFLSAGIVLFSGSLYVLSLTGTLWIGALTPIGGLCLIAGWVTLARVRFTR